MEPIKEVTKQEALISIKNDLTRELCLSEVNVMDMSAVKVINPIWDENMEKALTSWKEKVKNINRSMAIINKMIFANGAQIVEEKL